MTFDPIRANLRHPALLPDGRLYVPWKHRPGGILLRQGDYSQEVFTFIAKSSKEQHHFYVPAVRSRIMARPRRYPAWPVRFRPEDIQNIIQHNGIEADHLKRLSPERLEEPGILVQMPNDTQVVIDGNHRAVARYAAGLPMMTFWAPTLEQCRLCLLDIPDEIGAREVFSGKA